MRVLLFLCICLSVRGYAQNAPGEALLIGTTVEGRGLARSYVYQYGRAEKLDVIEVLPAVAMHGTPKQRRRAKRLLKGVEGSAMLTLGGLAGSVSTGFFGPAQLQTRQTVYLSGMATFITGLLVSVVQHGQARRLVRAYNDTLLNRTSDYVRTFDDRPLPTLADTVAITKQGYSYRGVPDILPSRMTGFDWQPAQPRWGISGSLGLGLITVGSLLMGINSVVALGPGDYRRFSWAGAGMTVLGFGLTIPVGRVNHHRQLDTIRQYNQRVRDWGMH